jgi:hypothetical protein
MWSGFYVGTRPINALRREAPTKKRQTFKRGGPSTGGTDCPANMVDLASYATDRKSNRTTDKDGPAVAVQVEQIETQHKPAAKRGEAGCL